VGGEVEEGLEQEEGEDEGLTVKWEGPRMQRIDGGEGEEDLGLEQRFLLKTRLVITEAVAIITTAIVITAINIAIMVVTIILDLVIQERWGVPTCGRHSTCRRWRACHPESRPKRLEGGALEVDEARGESDIAKERLKNKKEEGKVEKGEKGRGTRVRKSVSQYGL